MTDSERLASIGEYMAAGLMEEPAASPVKRWSRAVRRGLENRPLEEFDGGPLYPCGLSAIQSPEFARSILRPNLVLGWVYSREALDRRLEGAPEELRETLKRLGKTMDAIVAGLETVSGVHTVGGAGFIHSVPNYSRVVEEGFACHAGRVEAALVAAQIKRDAASADFESGLLDVLEGIGVWRRRIIEYLGDERPRTAEAAENRARLLDAYSRVPFAPAESFFEAFLSYTFTFYLDYCDNPGRIDQVLWPYYRRDLESGAVSREDAAELMSAFTESCCANGSWSAAIGGTTPSGEPGYNELTLVCLETVRGKFRPNYELRVRRDMPDEVWNAAFDALASGCGQPALYSEEGYYDSLTAAELGLDFEDLSWWNGGGCTETMIQGLSNVGSLDSGINLPFILVRTMKERLAAAPDFQSFLEGYKRDIADTVEEITAGLNRMFRARASITPHPLRSLLVDDCIERGRDFQAGGARYNWSVVNVAGLATVADSLEAIREVVYENGEVTGGELIEVLESDFGGNEPFRRRLLRCPKFGNDIPSIDSSAADLCRFVFDEFRSRETVRGGRFLPSCIMFATYAWAGKEVGATPDGRRAGDPIGDSMGPVNGRDTHGPTAMMKSVTKLPLSLATGTPIVNMRLSRASMTVPESRARVKDLVRTYFEMGGMQLQLNVVDQETIRDAIAHPEAHESLIVRIGGYSVHFNQLSDELKLTILERTEHAV